MTTGLLDRVRFLGGNGGTPADEPTLPLPPLDLGPDALDADPQPAPETRKRSKPEVSAATAAKQPRTGGKFVSTSKQKQDLADEINMWLKMCAGMWSMSDEVCAGVLNETSAQIAADLAALGARSEWVMEQFRTTSLLGDCMKLLIHTWPLIKAMYAHHGRPQLVDDDPNYEPVSVADPDAPIDLNAYPPFQPQSWRNSAA